MRQVCVFCGSSAGAREEFAVGARAMGQALARHSLGLIYGGGKVGLMGIIADAVLAAGGQVVGVIPEALAAKEIAHTGLADLRVVGSMHERKALMADLADGFIAMPGGFGTWDEFCEIITWAQLGYHRKPCGLLNLAGYYDPLLAMVERSVSDGFVRPAHAEMVLVEEDPTRLLERMASYTPPELIKWVSREEI